MKIQNSCPSKMLLSHFRAHFGYVFDLTAKNCKNVVPMLHGNYFVLYMFMLVQVGKYEIMLIFDGGVVWQAFFETPLERERSKGVKGLTSNIVNMFIS